MENLAIIPARSGSKGLKDKNIKLLNGIPLMGYSIIAAKNAGLFKHIMVSTDSERYAEIAQELGAEVPFLRSQKRSGDSAGSWEVVLEVLNGYQEQFDTVCLLQPTSPLRSSKDIIGGYDLLKSKGADAVTSVCEVEHSPLWAMTLDTDLSLKEFRKHISSVPRQMLRTYYRLNGALYIRKIKYSKTVEILDSNEFAYIMDPERSVDIDTENDFLYAEYLINKQAGNCG